MVRLENFETSLAGGFRLAVPELAVPKGEALAVIGPNGAGKTTLLNALALLQDAKASVFELNGRDALAPANRLALRRSMACLFSRPYLVRGTVHDNVVLPLRFRGAADRGEADEMLRLFRVEHLRDRDAGRLSHGEGHRVALARAFVTRPGLVLLDEPFSSLDARAREGITRDLSAAVRAAGTTLVLVTQDQEEALALGDKLAVLAGGRLLQHGTPQEVYSRPASAEVAEFTGVETIVPGTVSSKADNLCVVRAGGEEFEVVSACEPGHKVLVCVRPEAVSLSKAPEHSSARNHFRGRVTAAEQWRLEYKVSVDCGFPVIAAVTRRSLEELGLKPGAEVCVSFKATAAHLVKR